MLDTPGRAQDIAVNGRTAHLLSQTQTQFAAVAAQLLVPRHDDYALAPCERGENAVALRGSGLICRVRTGPSR